MKCLLLAIAFMAIIFLSSCGPARVGVGVGVGPRPYYGARPYYRPRPYYNPYYYRSPSWGRPHHRSYYRRY